MAVKAASGPEVAATQFGADDRALTFLFADAELLMSWARSNWRRFPYPNGADRQTFWEEVWGDVLVKIGMILRHDPNARWNPRLLYAIVWRRAIDGIRKANREQAVPLDDDTGGRRRLSDTLADPKDGRAGEVVRAKETVRDALRWLKGVRPDNAAVVELTLDELPQNEIAMRLGVSRVTVEQRFRRAKVQMRQYLESQ